jgi:hypothetical protein
MTFGLGARLDLTIVNYLESVITTTPISKPYSI